MSAPMTRSTPMSGSAIHELPRQTLEDPARVELGRHRASPRRDRADDAAQDLILRHAVIVRQHSKRCRVRSIAASQCAQFRQCWRSGRLALQRCEQPLCIVLSEVELMCCRRGEDLEEHELVRIVLSSGLVQGFAAWLLECGDKSLLEDGLHLNPES